MKYLNTYKIFEGIYQNLQKEIKEVEKSYQDNTKRIKDEYLQEVKDCLVDITDNYRVDELSVDDSTLSEELKVLLNVILEYDQVNNFKKDYIESYNRCKSHIGKDIKTVQLMRMTENGYYYPLFNSNTGFKINSINDIDKVMKREEGEKVSIFLVI